MVVVEFDGMVTYGGSEGRAELAAEKHREDDIRSLGHGVARVVWADLFSPPLVAALLCALALAALIILRGDDTNRVKARIQAATNVVKGNHVEHWLNGAKILEYTLDSGELRTAIADSKFKDMAGFDKHQRGHILLPHHPGVVQEFYGPGVNHCIVQFAGLED